MDWRLNTVIKAKSETGNWYTNIVGTLATKENEYIYKVSRIPSFRGFWEFLISCEIKSKLSSIKNFARVIDVQKLLLDIDEDGKTIPSVKNKKKRERNVMIQKIVLGISLAKNIKCGCTEEFLFDSIFQILAALYCAQKLVKFTHYDLHGNNVLLEKEKIFEGKQIFYLYDIDNNPSLIPSYGYRAKIIDYEYSHVDNVNGKAFDSRLDLINRFYIPSEFDPSYDVLRFVISSCSYMAEKQSSDLCKEIVSEIVKMVNVKDNLKVQAIDGLIEEMPDPIRAKVLELCKKKGIKLIDSLYYYIVSILLHNVKLPFKKVHNIDTEEEILLNIGLFVNFLYLLLEFSENIDNCCTTLFEFLSGRKLSFQKMGDEWNGKFIFLLHSSIDSLQTLYNQHIIKCRDIRNKQDEYKFTPLKMMKFLQTKIELKKDIKNGDLIYYMNEKERRKLIIDLSKKQENMLNSSYDVFYRAEIIKQFL